MTYIETSSDLIATWIMSSVVFIDIHLLSDIRSFKPLSITSLVCKVKEYHVLYIFLGSPVGEESHTHM